MKNGLVAVLLLSLIPMICFAQQWDPDPNGEARRINELAAADKIHSEQDARNYVDALAHAFGDKYGWFTSGVRHKLARAEYLAVHNNRLVSDDRLAKAVNEVFDATGAPAWARTNAVEVRNFRDANLAILTHTKMPVHLWHMPNIAARSQSGGLAEGSRPVEALMLLYLLTDSPRNLLFARDREQKGQLASVMMAEEANGKAAKATTTSGARLAVARTDDPREAEFNRVRREYLQSHNVADINTKILEAAKQLVLEGDSN